MYFLDESQIYVFEQRCVKDGLDSNIISVPICGLFVVTILEVWSALFAYLRSASIFLFCW